jgi:predicted transcriptional regulator
MPTKKLTVSVRLDPASARRLERAARLNRQSRGAFLERAGDELARRVLLEWAVTQHRAGTRSFSELAEETGLPIEEIMAAVGGPDQDAALALFLASCRAIAATEQHPEFLRLAEEAVAAVRASPGPV